MGCWNGTCAITNLPILYGEPCRIVFLRQSIQANDAGGGFCYTEGLWHPASLPIPAKYNDYGAVEDYDPDDWRIPHFMEWMRASVIEREQGENEFHQQAIVRDNLKSLDDVCDLLHGDSSRFRVLDDYSKRLLAYYEMSKDAIGADPDQSAEVKQGDVMAYCLIREDVYQGLLQMERHSWKGTLGIEKYYGEMEEWLDMAIEAHREKDGDDRSTQRLILRLSSGSTMWQTNEGIGPLVGSLREHILNEMEGVVRDGGDLDAYREVLLPRLRQVVEYRWVTWMMDSLRKHWSPQGGAGSQSFGWEAHEALILVTQRALVNMRRDCHEELDRPVMEAFWSRYWPPKVWGPSGGETYEVAEIKDAMGNKPEWQPQLPDLPDEAFLFVVDLEPEANLGHDHLWVLVSEDGKNVWRAKMGWPPKEQEYMEPVPYEEWPA